MILPCIDYKIRCSTIAVAVALISLSLSSGYLPKSVKTRNQRLLDGDGDSDGDSDTVATATGIVIVSFWNVPV